MKYLTIIFILLFSQNIFAESLIYHCKAKDAFKIKNNEEILAFVLTDGKILETALKIWLKERLAPYKIPQRIFVVKEFPTAATGKILKHKLLSYFSDII